MSNTTTLTLTAALAVFLLLAGPAAHVLAQDPPDSGATDDGATDDGAMDDGAMDDSAMDDSTDASDDPADVLRRLEALEAELAELRADREAAGGGDDAGLADQMMELEILLEALNEQVDSLEERVPAEKSQIDVSGFADYAFRVYNTNPGSGFFGHWESAGWGQTDLRFLIGANPAPWLRFFSEIRFFYTSPTPTNIIGDRADEFHFTLERVQAELKPLDFLAFRVGYWRTPFGLYGEDNGSPAYTTVTLPLSYQLRLFPQQQTGANAYGRVRVAEELEVGYDAFITNGLGSFPQIFTVANNGFGPLAVQYADPDQEPSWGGNLTLRFENLGPFDEIYGKVGYFNGWETDREFVEGNTQDWSRRRHHNTFVVAGRIQIGPVFLQTEWTNAFTPEWIKSLDPTNRNPDGSRIVLGPDQEFRTVQRTWYVQGGFTIESVQLTFYGMWEVVEGRDLFDPTGQFTRYDLDVFSWGITWRPESWLIVKYQTQLARFDQVREVNDIDMHGISMTVFFK